MNDQQREQGSTPRQVIDGVGQAARTAGQSVGKVAGVAVGAAGKVFGRTLRLAQATPRLHMPGLGRRPGASPGIDQEELAAAETAAQAAAGPVRITCIDYGPDQMETHRIEPADLDAFLHPKRPDWTAVRWINVDGLTDPAVIRTMAKWYKLHPLAVEDVLHTPQRPKVEPFAGEGTFRARLFLIARMVLWDTEQEAPVSEQVSMFLGNRTVITFQERPGDVWDPIRERIAKPGSRLRTNDASFLVYALLDALVDFYYPVLERYGERLDDLEEQIHTARHLPEGMYRQVHRVRRELLLLRREIWPLREVLQVLQREPHENVSETTQMYLRDVYDHAVQIIDFIETAREIASGVADTYMNAASHRMNEVMKVLTVIATIFIPITFIAGVYGMNFEHMPELDEPWAYPTFWAVCAAVVAALLIFFRRRRWL